MRVGVPKEIKDNEFRVGLTPASVRELVRHGHSTLVETLAGEGVGFSDEDYRAAGASVVPMADEVFAEADLIVKVKEPQPWETARLTSHHSLFTYLHLAPDLQQASALVESGCTAIAYETVTDNKGRLPLLAPMSEIAGRMAIQVGAHWLEKPQAGAGILLGGVPGVPRAKVIILGGGTSGSNAARMAVGLEADVTVIDKSLERLRDLDGVFGSRLHTTYATADAIESHVSEADLVIGAVLVPGAAAPKIVPRELIARMRKGSVLVDISIDQGGCFETSRPTSHGDPTYVVEGVIHYCVANMPGAVPRTSTIALNNATLPFVLALAEKGPTRALTSDPNLMSGLNVHRGRVTHRAVAEALRFPFTPPDAALAMQGGK
jgi:alanine dehydrogenase